MSDKSMKSLPSTTTHGLPKVIIDEEGCIFSPPNTGSTISGDTAQLVLQTYVSISLNLKEKYTTVEGRKKLRDQIKVSLFAGYQSLKWTPLAFHQCIKTQKGNCKICVGARR